MGKWNVHGMADDDEMLMDAIAMFGFTPDELVMLSDHASGEVWIWEEIAKREKGQEKRRCNLIAGYWRRRSRKWKELAAAAEREFEETLKENDAEEA